MKRRPSNSKPLLHRLRQHIDAVDARLLHLLTQRAALALHVRRIKKREGWKLLDPVREQAILRRMITANSGPLTPQAVRAIYRTILTQMRRLEQRAS
ncbi:MAG: chorismate mutase [Candidatus Omnitrophica bacterium]|nr:chorismate mutase [Candidatus Omnitrophota bacterium]